MGFPIHPAKACHHLQYVPACVRYIHVGGDEAVFDAWQESEHREAGQRGPGEGTKEARPVGKNVPPVAPEVVLISLRFFESAGIRREASELYTNRTAPVDEISSPSTPQRAQAKPSARAFAGHAGLRNLGPDILEAR